MWAWFCIVAARRFRYASVMNRRGRRESDRASVEYLMELDKLPRLDEAGDGIRSYVGLWLEANCGAHPVLFIDEPEAFLHPPQIRRLAAILAKSAEDKQRQIIIATHSSDVLRGALDASSNVTVCRLTRTANVNHGRLLSSTEIRKLWSKPLLKSVAALDGVFHQGVVVCEADADARFYEAVLRSIELRRQVERPPAYHFIHGGGKGELATLASAYRALHVPVAVIADIDILRNKPEFEKLFASLGGDFETIQGMFNSSTSDT